MTQVLLLFQPLLVMVASAAVVAGLIPILTLNNKQSF